MIYVIIQCLSFAMLLLHTNLYGFGIGSGVLVVIGIVIGIFAIKDMKSSNIHILPQVGKNAELVTTGIYKYARHPMYTSIYLFSLGLLLTHPNSLSIGFYIVLVIILYLKSLKEEEYLTQVFNEYPQYQKSTGRFLPKLLKLSMTRIRGKF